MQPVVKDKRKRSRPFEMVILILGARMVKTDDDEGANKVGTRSDIPEVKPTLSSVDEASTESNARDRGPSMLWLRCGVSERIILINPTRVERSTGTPRCYGVAQEKHGEGSEEARCLFWRLGAGRRGGWVVVCRSRFPAHRMQTKHSVGGDIPYFLTH